MRPDDQHNAADSGDLPPWLVLAVAVVVTLSLVHAPPAVFAFSQDSDYSLQNFLQGGSFDGNLTEVGPATENSTTDEGNADQIRDTWEDYSHKNGSVDPVNNTIEIGNPNTTFTVREVNVTASYTENDTTLNNLNAVSTAKTMNITMLRYNGTNQTIKDANNNGRADLDDLSQITLTLDGVPANETVPLTLAIAGDATQDSGIGGNDGIDFTLQLTLVVDPSWRDADESTQNTIQYNS